MGRPLWLPARRPEERQEGGLWPGQGGGDCVWWALGRIAALRAL